MKFGVVAFPLDLKLGSCHLIISVHGFLPVIISQNEHTMYDVTGEFSIAIFLDLRHAA